MFHTCLCRVRFCQYVCGVLGFSSPVDVVCFSCSLLPTVPLTNVQCSKFL